MATRTLRLTAELLLAAEECLKLAERPDAIIALQEIEEAGTRWSSRKSLPPIRLHPKLSRQRFIHHAAGEPPNDPPHDGDPPSPRPRRDPHDSSMARACPTDHDEHLCGRRF